MEGGFSRALLLGKADGSELVVKLPFKIAGPAKYTTAAEVAVMQYGNNSANAESTVHSKLIHY